MIPEENTNMNKTNNISPVLRACIWLLFIGLIIALLIYFKTILVPLVYAIVAAFLVHELILLTGKIYIFGKPIPHWLRNFLVLLIVIGTIFGIVQILSANVDQIVKKAPEYQQTVERLIDQAGTLTGAEDNSAEIREWINSINISSLFGDVFSSFSSFLGNLFMVIIYGLFLLAERRKFTQKLDAMLPNTEDRKDLQEMLDQIADAIRQYLSVKTLVSLLTGILCYIILLLFGVDFPVLWAFLVFLLNYIPYLGSLIATLLPTFLAIFQFESLLMGLWVFLCIQSVQTLVGTFLEPRFAGKTLNLSPTVVLFSLALWGSVWGIAGMAIAIPVTSIFVIIMAEFPNTRNAAILLSERGDLS